MNQVKEFSEALPPVVKQTGIAAELPAEVILKAGNLSVTYSNGALRYISADTHELIRMICSAVRDKNWLTVSPLVVEEKIEAEETSFKISLKCLYTTEDINISASYLIEGRHDNSITLAMEGKVMDKSLKNRIGWCVLHPVEGCTGENCLIEHTDGSTEQSVFPEDIAPHQVFREIKSMIWISNRILRSWLSVGACTFLRQRYYFLHKSLS